MYLVLNLGLKSIRAIVFDQYGNIAANIQQPLQTRLNGGMVEQSVDEWWSRGLDVIRATCANDVIKKSVRYITVTSSSCCLISVDNEAQVLHEAIMVSDKRAQEEADFISALDIYKRLRKKREDFNVTSSLMLPKILWLKKISQIYLTVRDFFLAQMIFLHFV